LGKLAFEGEKAALKKAREINDGDVAQWSTARVR
jgi:hypothetical protein